MQLTKTLLFLILIYFLLIPNQSYSESCGKIMPIDEASQDQSFVQFRTLLIQAIERKDKIYLQNVIDPHIIWNFGSPKEQQGIKTFVKEFNLENPHSPIWKELLIVLKNGGGFSQNEGHPVFQAPYLSSGSVWKKVPERCSEGCISVIFGKNIPVFTKASQSSPLMQTLSYDIIKLAPNQSNERTNSWAPILLGTEKIAYVEKKWIRNSCDWRAIFEKKKGKWLLSTYIAGD